MSGEYFPHSKQKLCKTEQGTLSNSISIHSQSTEIRLQLQREKEKHLNVDTVLIEEDVAVVVVERPAISVWRIIWKASNNFKQLSKIKTKALTYRTNNQNTIFHGSTYPNQDITNINSYTQYFHKGHMRINNRILKYVNKIPSPSNHPHPMTTTHQCLLSKTLSS